MALRPGYKEYITSQRWLALRREALERDGYRCRGCNTSEHLQVHHRRYASVLGCETVDDLTTLCAGPGGCHHVITEVLKRRKELAAAAAAVLRKATRERRGTYDEAHALFCYEPSTGHLIWKVRRGPNAKIGTRAGSTTAAGYRMVYFNGRHEYVSRVVWLMHTGHWPAEEIGYKNLDLADTRFENLMPTSRLEVIRSRGLNRNNACGIKGVHAHKGRWRARIGYDHRTVDLGCFDTKEEAGQAYARAAAELHGQAANRAQLRLGDQARHG